MISSPTTTDKNISIHALREESDGEDEADGYIHMISIHALREESDESAENM